jgi:solute:Na+ symporter, SSS family
MTGVDYAIIAAFLVCLAAAGLAVSRLIRDSDDFFVAGRELTPFILGATITATNVSMFHFVAMGGTAYQSGVSIIWQNWTGDMALVLSGMFVLPVMRRLRVRSVPEFLQMRYSRWLRVLVGAFWGVRLCVYLGIILYIAGTAAVIITGWNNYVAWLFIFSLVSIIYSVVGGAWAVAIMDSVQFLVMLIGALIVLPVAMHAAGGFPALTQWLRTHGQANHVNIVPTQGEFNWIFILAIQLLSFKWSTVDQSILQRAFGARSPRVGAKGMVLAGIITTPFALFWVLPGIAVAKLHPQPFAKPDEAIPWLLSNTLPAVARGLLGVVLCGLVAAQVSVITADINSVATLFTSDVYRNLRSRTPTQRELLIVVRISSLICGALMILVAFGLQFTNAGAVRTNLVVVGILDMPLFIITVVYGLFWKRTNWQGAAAGFIAGGAVGVLSYFLINPDYFHRYLYPLADPLSHGFARFLAGWHEGHLRAYDRWKLSIAPIASTMTALIVTPLVSLLTARPSGERLSAIWDSFKAKDDTTHETAFHVIPNSAIGRTGMALALGGFAAYLCGVISASRAMPFASSLAVTGMIVVFVGGLMRVYAD